MTPRHVAVLLDGHTDWARANDLPEAQAYRLACRKQLQIARWCQHLGIQVLTLQVVPPTHGILEHPAVMADWDHVITHLRAGWIGARDLVVRHVGDTRRLPAELADRIRSVCTPPADKAAEQRFTVNLALGYEGRTEMVDALRTVLDTAHRNGRSLDEVARTLDAEDIGSALASRHPLPVDLMIRTTGPRHFSAFLPWQAAYAEFYFSTKPAPALTRADLEEAFASYARRSRRYGK